MSEDKKSALLKATQKLKNAKKQKDPQENNSNKRAMNDRDNDSNDDSIVSNIVNAVRRFKGD